MQATQFADSLCGRVLQYIIRESQPRIRICPTARAAPKA